MNPVQSLHCSGPRSGTSSPDKILDMTLMLWLKEYDMVRMDTKGSQDSTKGMYTVKCGKDSFEFHCVDMPPPSPVFTTNYTRFVKDRLHSHICLTIIFRFIHHEGSPHKYAVSWTTMRDPQLRKEDGGHFFMCSHGIKVTAAPDTVVVW
jgi:hypothetical protein